MTKAVKGRWRSRRGTEVLILPALLLLLLTLAVYFPLPGHDFAAHGDDLWITENDVVQSVLNMDSIGWAFTFVDTGSWHPLSWISVILDARIFGVDPGGHHLTNLFLHAAAVLLFFLVLRGMTGAQGKSFTAAAFYAVHPLNVETVARAAARPEVLGAFFWMLTLFLYDRYARRPGPGRYLAVAGGFACGLLSSPMMAALPLILLLLDIWPLRRLPWGDVDPGALNKRYPAMPVREVIQEKIPLVALSLVSLVVNVFVREENRTVAAGLAEGLYAPLWYAGKALWPVGLAVSYPGPGGTVLTWSAIIAALLLAAVTVLAAKYRRRMPTVALGWFWYLSALLPVAVLAAGADSFPADRHAGVPLAGLLIMFVWGVTALASGRIPSRIVQAAAALLLAVLVFAAGSQVRVWKDSGPLIDHTLAVKEDDAFAHRIYGKILAETGDNEEAVRHYRESFRLDPGSSGSRKDLTLLLLSMGREEEVIEEYRKVRERDPENPRLTFLLGSELARQRRYGEAVPVLREAMEQRPDHVRTMRNLATALLRLEEYEEAARLYRRTLEIEPGNSRAERNLGEALVELGEFQEAAELLGEALADDPERAKTHYYLGRALQGIGEGEEAEKSYREALRLQPEYPETHEAWGTLLYGRKRFEEALEHFREASRGLPESDNLKRRQGDSLLRLNRLAEAEEQYRGALILNPGNHLVHNNLGTVLFRRGKVEEAVTSYGKALEIDPEFSMAYFNLANVIFKHGEPGEAIPLYDRALELRPDFEKAREYRDRALRAAGEGREGRR